MDNYKKVKRIIGMAAMPVLLVYFSSICEAIDEVEDYFSGASPDETVTAFGEPDLGYEIESQGECPYLDGESDFIADEDESDLGSEYFDALYDEFPEVCPEDGFEEDNGSFLSGRGSNYGHTISRETQLEILRGLARRYIDDPQRLVDLCKDGNIDDLMKDIENYIVDIVANKILHQVCGCRRFRIGRRICYRRAPCQIWPQVRRAVQDGLAQLDDLVDLVNGICDMAMSPPSASDAQLGN